MLWTVATVKDPSFLTPATHIWWLGLAPVATGPSTDKSHAVKLCTNYKLLSCMAVPTTDVTWICRVLAGSVPCVLSCKFNSRLSGPCWLTLCSEKVQNTTPQECTSTSVSLSVCMSVSHCSLYVTTVTILIANQQCNFCEGNFILHF